MKLALPILHSSGLLHSNKENIFQIKASFLNTLQFFIYMGAGGGAEHEMSILEVDSRGS